MLDRSYKTARPFAEDLAAKGFRLSAMPSTILGELLNLSSPVEFENKVPNVSSLDYATDIERFGDKLQFHTEGNNGQMWGASFDQVVDTLSKSLNVQLGYIRNVIVPRTKEFTQDALKYIEDLGKTNPAQELEVKRNVIPELIQDSAFLIVLDPHKLKAIAKPKNSSLSINFKEVPADFLQVASLSNNRLDGLTALWSKSCDFNYLESVWYSFFAGPDLTRRWNGPFISPDEMTSQDLYVRLNVSLAYFLFANYYSKNKPDVDMTESAASFDQRLFDHMRYAGAVLSDTLKRILDQNAANILVTHVDTFHKKISVSAEVYDRWLQTGGSVETILGILVGDKRFHSVDAIDENAKSLKQTWSNYVRIYLESIEYRKAESLRSWYLEHLALFLTEPYQEELELSEVMRSPSKRDAMLQTASKWLATLKKDDLLSAQKVSKKLIAGIKYHFTYAENFINDMEEIGALAEHAEPEEAALIATINYIVDYLQGQLSVSRV